MCYKNKTKLVGKGRKWRNSLGPHWSQTTKPTGNNSTTAMLMQLQMNRFLSLIWPWAVQNKSMKQVLSMQKIMVTFTAAFSNSKATKGNTPHTEEETAIIMTLIILSISEIIHQWMSCAIVPNCIFPMHAHDYLYNCILYINRIIYNLYIINAQHTFRKLIWSVYENANNVKSGICKVIISTMTELIHQC